MVPVKRDKGELNEIPKVIGRRPDLADRSCPVPVGNGTEHNTIQHHDHTESAGRSDAEHYHHELRGSDVSDAGPDQSDHRCDGYSGRPSGEADRYDDHHNHAPAEGEADRHHNHHNRAAARGEEGHHIDDHNHSPAAIVECT